MIKLSRKNIIFIVIGVLVLAAVVYGFRPEPIPVQTAVVVRDSLRVTVEEEGRTQVAERYVLSSPVAAVARRIDVEVGDSVARGQPLVYFDPPRPALLDARTRAEAQARVEAAEAVAERARKERRRVERLAEEGSATHQMLEQAIADARRATANLAAARAALQAHETSGANAPTVLRAPVTGRVLAVHRSSGGPVRPGEALIEVGDVDGLEIHIDVLSQDAVRIEPGTRVLIEQWGGDAVLEAIVDRVEPQGRTDVSSLGVEQQRVTIVAHVPSPPAQWREVGVGYRVLARFIVWEGSDVLQVPTSALFRTEDGWAVFVIEAGTAERRRLRVGHQAGLSAQILSGLKAGDVVILHPGNEIDDGARVEPREP